MDRRPRYEHVAAALVLSLAWAGCAATGAPGSVLGEDDGHLGTSSWSVAPRVLVIDWDPRLASQGGSRASTLPNYTDPRELAEGFAADMQAATGDAIRYRITEWVDVDGYPMKEDGTRPTEEQWLECLADPDGCPLGTTADYAAIVADYDICGRVERGEIDEVWLFGGPWFGFYESRMAGNGAFFVNSPPLRDVRCSRRFVLMGFNYERGVAEMMHDVGHRLESTMDHAFRYWRAHHPFTRDPFSRFRAYDGIDPGAAACGDTHHPPNSAAGEEYVYDSTREVSSSCAAFTGWPSLDAPPEVVSCADWGCNQEGYMGWLFERVPRQPGTDVEGGYQRNWWKYVYAFDTYLPVGLLTDRASTPAEDPSEPSDPSGSTGGSSGTATPPPGDGGTPSCDEIARADCDARADCEFFACADQCAARGTMADDLCGPAQDCGAYDSIESCDMHRDHCAWYACANRCYPNATPLERACPATEPSCETSGTIETCAPRGPTCAWYACANRCYPSGLPLSSACPGY